jgi:hypothetical protein
MSLYLIVNSQKDGLTKALTFARLHSSHLPRGRIGFSLEVWELEIGQG